MIESEVEFDLDMDIEFDTEIEMIPDAMEEFYKKEFWFSYSSMKLLLYNPPAFAEKYINKNYEEKLAKHLIAGKLIHCLILQPDEFPDMFIISPLKVPEGKNRDIMHAVFKHHKIVGGSNMRTLEDYSDILLQELITFNLHQSLKLDSARLDKMLTDENKTYFDYQLTRGNKNVIDQKQLDYCTQAAKVITDNPEMCRLMGIGADPAFNEVINEQMYYMPQAGRKFGLKGIVDNINIDHAGKVIYVNDFKTTGKELSEFPEAVTFFCYHYQAVIYLSLVAFHFQSLIYSQGYRVEFRFIAIDKNLQAYAFRIAEVTLNSWLDTFSRKLNEAAYHYDNKTYELPYAFANDLVLL